jgi:hypothetical protein
VKDDDGDLIADSHILNGRKSYFSHRMYTGVSDVRQTKIHTAERLVPELSPFEVKTVTANFKRHRSSETDKILARNDRSMRLNITFYVCVWHGCLHGGC